MQRTTLIESENKHTERPQNKQENPTSQNLKPISQVYWEVFQDLK